MRKVFEVKQLKRIEIEVIHPQMARGILEERLADGEIVFDMNATITEVEVRR